MSSNFAPFASKQYSTFHEWMETGILTREEVEAECTKLKCGNKCPACFKLKRMGRASWGGKVKTYKGSWNSDIASVTLTAGTGIYVGDEVTGEGIPTDTVVKRIDGNKLSISKKPTAAADEEKNITIKSVCLPMGGKIYEDASKKDLPANSQLWKCPFCDEISHATKPGTRHIYDTDNKATHIGTCKGITSESQREYLLSLHEIKRKKLTQGGKKRRKKKKK